MAGLGLLALLASWLVLLGVLEASLHRRRWASIPIRILVTGTRGKSSVTRLIAAGLSESGLRTCAKTTGSQARVILPDRRELVIERTGAPNVIEQKRVMALAARERAQAVVIECMALDPELQALSGLTLVAATHAVITNSRPDHLDRMGPTEADVARAFAGSIPPGGRLFSTERRQRAILQAAADDRGCRACWVEEAEIQAVGEQELERFGYIEHRENVALALRVCAELGVARDVALAGMWRAAADPGALTAFEVGRAGSKLVFYNAFAANDPVSTGRLWRYATLRHPEAGARIALFNCRADRPERSLQLARALVGWPAPDRVVLMGSGTGSFARAALRAGLPAHKLVSLGKLAPSAVFERVLDLADGPLLVVGMGNIGGDGLALARHVAALEVRDR